MSLADQNSTNLRKRLLRVEKVDWIFLCCVALWMWEMKLVDNLHIKKINLSNGHENIFDAFVP